MRRSLVIAVAAVAAMGVFAQAPNGIISAKLERDSIRIGEQTVLLLELDADGLPVAWPVFGDTLAAEVELISDEGIDTLSADGPAGERIMRRLVITSFEPGDRIVPAFRFRIGEQELLTEPLTLHVGGVELGDNATPKDIKPIRELPFSLSWWIQKHLAWVLGGCATIIAIVLLTLLLRRVRRATPAVEAPVPQEPLHVRILRELEVLEKERVWQQGDHKGYQSRLTDLLRSYIEERYQVPALERTTDELMHELRVSPLSVEQQNLIGNILRLADLVKFAKVLPAPQENEQMMASALRFVRETAITEQDHATRH